MYVLELKAYYLIVIIIVENNMNKVCKRHTDMYLKSM